MDVGSTIGQRNVVDGLGWNRRRDLEAWVARQRDQKRGRSLFQILYGWLRWTARIISPFNLMTLMVHFIKQYGMGGQYCDGSAARGVASAAMMMYGGSGNFGPGDDHQTKTSKHGHHGQHVMYPHAMERHTMCILFLARVWGTLCALSTALLALLQYDIGGETVGKMWVMFLGGLKSCLAIFRPNATSVAEQYVPSNTGSKKNRRKQQHLTQSPFNDPRALSAGISDSDFLNGKLQMTFEIFPDQIRSQVSSKLLSHFELQLLKHLTCIDRT